MVDELEAGGQTSEPRYTTKLVILVALTLGVILLIWLSRRILAPIIFGALLAYLLAPLVDWLDDRMPRALGILLSYLLVLAAAVVAFVIVPIAFFSALGEIDFLAIFDRIDDWAVDILEAVTTINLFGTSYDLSAVTGPLIIAINDTTPGVPVTPQGLGGFLSSAFAATAGLFGVVISTISFFIFTVLISISLTASGRRLLRGGLDIFPSSYHPEVKALGGRVSAVWRDYLRGELVLAMAIAFLVTVVAMLLGLPGAIFLGLLAGALELIPSFGPVIAAIPAVLVALISGSIRWEMPNLAFAILVVLAYVGIQVLENNLIGPKVLGDALRVPGLVVMIAITVGFQTAGVLGAILAVPIVASARVVTRYAWWKVTGVDLATRANAGM